MAPKLVTELVGGRYESTATESFERKVKIDFLCTGYGTTAEEAETDALRKLKSDPHYKQLSKTN